MLDIGGVVIDPHFEPPRPPITPPARRGNHKPTFDVDGNPGEIITDMGNDPSWLVRFVSNEHQGILTFEEREALEALYSTGLPFRLLTDLTVPLGNEAVEYQAVFEPGAPPRFDPVDPGGRLYYMDVVLRVRFDAFGTISDEWPAGGPIGPTTPCSPLTWLEEEE
jgi:hypothetical protein